ncbi:Glycosyltransferase, GT2 family [Streptomyces indicus]|uniref:Glycosyltransferase, GT2 family n=2 Tax=Streptomyces indicus TaxID=417292 RepID=A0A1G9CHG3_9ACTN|nr:Glycosyltransferase, GT2 family [Streptomyces indicus]
MQPLVAVLMTSHNRCATTLSALDALKRQCGLPAGTALHPYLVDAGSTDGTADAVRLHHPDVQVMEVGDDVFWGGGMRIASRNSRAAGGPAYTHQLWLNDDVVLDDDALAVLLTVARQEPEAIVVGAVHDGARTTYSGRRGRGLDLVEPSGRPEPCDTYNGNVVLIPRAARDLVGDVDKRFPHGMGDYDHGFRARKAGVPALVAPRHVGRCRRNPPLSGSREPGIGVREALRRVTSVRELPPRAWWAYCLRHAGRRAPVLMVSPYVMTVLRAGVRR